MKTTEELKRRKKLGLLQFPNIPMDMEGSDVIEFKQQIDDVLYAASSCSGTELEHFHHLLRLNQILMEMIIENFIEIEVQSSL